MFKKLKLIISLSSMALLLVACSSKPEESVSYERSETTSQAEDDKRERQESKETEEEVREPDYSAYPYFVDLSYSKEPITFGVYEGANQLIIEAENAWSGQITHHHQPDETSIHYTYQIEEIPAEKLIFTSSGFSGIGRTLSNTKLIIDKNGEELEAYVCRIENNFGPGYGLVFPNQLVFDEETVVPYGTSDNQNSQYDPKSQTVFFGEEELNLEDFYGSYRAIDSQTGPLIGVEADLFSFKGQDEKYLAAIEDIYVEANTLFITTRLIGSDQHTIAKLINPVDGSIYYLSGDHKFIKTDEEISFEETSTYTPEETDFSDEDLALMAYLKVRNFTNHDLNTDEFYIDSDPFGNGNLIVSGLTTGSSRVFEVDRENHRVYHWDFLDWSNAGPRTSRAEVLNSGAINRERPSDPEAEYYTTYDLMGEFANSYTIDSFQEGKANVTHYDNSDYYDSLPQ